MEIAQFCARDNILVLLLALFCSPSKFIQSPMDLGRLNFHQNTNKASMDFGRIHFSSPSAILRPKSPADISLLLSFLSGSSSFSEVTVAARGAGHSIYGQAQALDGIVIEMDAMPSSVEVHKKGEEEVDVSYVDVSGGALWIELLDESLKHGLAPRSWTDYLYLSIGGTLSIGGISGQAFKYGPQISNVLQLDVVTGKGEVVTCSPTKSSELFFSVLGGLGQFGIITRARIPLQEAPEKVKWVRAFYDDIQTFTQDQELLISMPNLVDYLEGFIVLSERSLNSFTTAFPAHLHFAPEFHSEGRSKVYYCIEYAVHDHSSKDIDTDQVVEEVSRQMRNMPSQSYTVEVSYYDFLNRVRMEEMSLRSAGLWEVPHPWLNMFVPKSGISEFVDLFSENISAEEFEGPVLVYPILRDKWDRNTSMVLPDAGDDQVVYIVGMLRSTNQDSCPAGYLQNSKPTAASPESPPAPEPNSTSRTTPRRRDGSATSAASTGTGSRRARLGSIRSVSWRPGREYSLGDPSLPRSKQQTPKGRKRKQDQKPVFINRSQIQAHSHFQCNSTVCTVSRVDFSWPGPCMPWPEDGDTLLLASVSWHLV